MGVNNPCAAMLNGRDEGRPRPIGEPLEKARSRRQDAYPTSRDDLVWSCRSPEVPGYLASEFPTSHPSLSCARKSIG